MLPVSNIPVNKGAQMVLVIAFCLVLVLSVASFFWWDIRRDSRQSNALLKKVDLCPQDIEKIELADNDPITVWVSFKGEKRSPITTIHGTASVRYFDSLKAKAPNARFEVTVNGRPASDAS